MALIYQRIDYFASIAGDSFKIASVFWNRKFSDGYFATGPPYISSNSEVASVAYPNSVLSTHRDEIYRKMDESNEQVIQAFYGNGGTIAMKNHSKDDEYRKLIGDSTQNIEDKIKNLLLIFFNINLFNYPYIFYLEYVNSCFTGDIDKFGGIINRRNSSNNLKTIFNVFKLTYYIAKVIPLSKDEVRTFAKENRELLIWKSYEAFRAVSLMTKEKGINFDKEFFGGYICFDADKDMYITPRMKEKATGYAAILMMRMMGRSAFIMRNRIDSNLKFKTLVFLVTSRLLILNQIYHLHADLHCSNFVFHISLYEKDSNFIKFEDLYIQNNINLYCDYDLIDFGDCVSFREADRVLAFIKRTVPNIYKNYSARIEELAEISILDLAVASTYLDLLTFIQDFYDKHDSKALFVDAKTEMEEWLIDNYTAYLRGGDKDKFVGGNQNDYSDEDRNDNYVADLSEHRSIFARSEPMFRGGELEGATLPAEDSKVNHLDSKSLPLYRFMEHFYRDESNKIDKSRVIDPIQ